MIHIFCTPHKYYPRLVWEGNLLYYRYPSIKNLIKSGGKIKYSDFHSPLFITERVAWQPFLKYEINQYAPNRLRGENRWKPAFNELIRLGLIMTVKYPPYSEIYVAMPGVNNYGHVFPLNSPSTVFHIEKIKNSIENPPNGYDSSRLNWL